jgi:hypothetical protein
MNCSVHITSALPSHDIAFQIIGNLRFESAWLCHTIGLWAGTIISEEPAASIFRVVKNSAGWSWLLSSTKLGGFCGSEYEDFSLITRDAV